MGGDVDGKWSLKRYLRVLLIVFASLLFVGTLACRKVDGFAARKLSENLSHVIAGGMGRHSVSANPDLVDVSQRRVPSGPDPVHNRHIGQTRQPPGRV